MIGTALIVLPDVSIDIGLRRLGNHTQTQPILACLGGRGMDFYHR